MTTTLATVNLPWGAWYGETWHEVDLPDHWSVDVLAPHGAPACSRSAIEQAVNSPFDSPSLVELAHGCRSACLAVDDLARPTRAGDVLPTLLEQLHAGGIPAEGIQIVVATGTHGTLSEEQLAWKVGRHVSSGYRVECHDYRAELASTGIRYGDRELRINRTFSEAELKIAVGSVLPHSFAGYSGGAKLVLPGLADVTSTARSHKFVQLGLRGGGDPNENRFRLEAEDLARQLGLKFVVCVVSNAGRETTHVSAGDVAAAHRRACRIAQDVYRTELHATYDCVLLNAYPKDTDLIQANNVFVALKTAKAPVVREDGVIVLTTAASEGIGRHGLFEPGGFSYRPPRTIRSLGSRELWIYAPNVSREDVGKIYWNGYPTYHSSAELTAALADRFPNGARAAVFPCASMQQVHDRRIPAGITSP